MGIEDAGFDNKDQIQDGRWREKPYKKCCTCFETCSGVRPKMLGHLPMFGWIQVPGIKRPSATDLPISDMTHVRACCPRRLALANTALVECR
jgi:hypothetical protein